MCRGVELFRILSAVMYEKNERHGRKWGSGGSVDQLYGTLSPVLSVKMSKSAMEQLKKQKLLTRDMTSLDS